MMDEQQEMVAFVRETAHSLAEGFQTRKVEQQLIYEGMQGIHMCMATDQISTLMHKKLEQIKAQKSEKMKYQKAKLQEEENE